VKRLSTTAVLFLATIAAALFLPSANAAPPQKAPEPDTLMLFAKQADDPVHIVQATFKADNSLMDALLENKSHQKIQSYRLSWAVVKKDDVRLAKGVAVDVPGNIDTSASFTIPGPENVAREDLAKHPSGIIFYIAELQFSDGQRWQAEPKKIRKEAVEMMK
jgi:hypothetical protein